MSVHPNRKWVFFNMDKRNQRQRIESEELEQMIEDLWCTVNMRQVSYFQLSTNIDQIGR